MLMLVVKREVLAFVFNADAYVRTDLKRATVFDIVEPLNGHFLIILNKLALLCLVAALYLSVVIRKLRFDIERGFRQFYLGASPNMDWHRVL